MNLTQHLPHPDERTNPDALYAAFAAWVTSRGLTLYPHQDEAVLELVSGNNVILATPTGSGKSLVATAAHFFALGEFLEHQRQSYYTAPIKALVSEKFFDLCEVFGAENVGMITGDAAVNPSAPLICCTAEVLANIALRDGDAATIGSVVMDEFHFYAEPQRGWAWQVPLLTLPKTQFLLMSATLGDVSFFRDDLTRRTGRATAVVDNAERPIPLDYTWAMTPLHETLEDLLRAKLAPVYMVHFTQAAALERAQSLLSLNVLSKEEKDAINERIHGFRFAKGFGQTLNKLVKHGIGVHHAGLLPKYRRLVEQLAQDGLLKVICGTDTLGVGINVPIRTVLLTGLSKYDGHRQRILKSREFHQIAGRAGRAGFDTAGTVVVQAPEHVIDNARAIAKAGDDPKKLRKVQRKKPPEGFVSWSEETFDRIVAAPPEPLQSRMQITHGMVLNIVARPGDPVRTLRHLLTDNHETPRNQARLQRRAIEIGRSLLTAGIVHRLPEPDERGRLYALHGDFQEGFALNQPLSTFALACLDLVDSDDPNYHLDVVSIIEATLEDPRAVLSQQQFKARGEAVAEMKADGIEYDERMTLLEEITHPRPLADLLEQSFATYRQTHPWFSEDDLSPKSVVRDMFTRAMTFGEFVSFYQLTRGEGMVLRYLSDAYRALTRTVPESYKNEELADLIEWLGEVVRQTDSSLLDEWEALTDPDRPADQPLRPSDIHHDTPAPLTSNPRALRVLVRNAMWRRVELAAYDKWQVLGELDAPEVKGEPGMTAEDWEAALGEYFDDYDDIGTGPDARGPSMLLIDTVSEPGLWLVQQIIDDPDGDREWRIYAEVDLEASDDEGDLVLYATAFRRA